MTRLTAKDHLGVEVQVVIARAVVAKTQGHTGQAQVMIAAVAAAGKLGHTKVLVTESLLRLARLEQDRNRESELPHLLDDGMLEAVVAKGV